MDSELLNVSAEGFRSLRSRYAIVTYVDQHEEQVEGQGKRKIIIDRLYPLREARIIDVGIVDGQVHVYFAVGRYVDPVPNQDVSAWLRALPEAKQPSAAYLSIVSLQQLPPFSDLTDRSMENAWQKLVAAVSATPLASRCFFYRVVALRRFDEATPTVEPEQLLRRSTGFTLRGGDSYFLDLAFYATEDNLNEIRGSSLETKVDDRYFHLTSPPYEINLRYDKHQVPLLPITTSSDSWTDLAISPSTGDVESATLRFIIKIVTPKLPFLLVAGVFGLGVIISTMVGPVFDLTGIDLPNGQRTNIEIACKVVGAFLQAFTFFFAYRRLPGVQR